MNTKPTLEELVRYYDATRGVGHTCATLYGIGDKGAIVIAHNQSYANHLKRTTGVETVSIHDLNALYGRCAPLVIDNAALREIFANSAAEIQRLESESLDWKLRFKNVVFQLEQTTTENIKLQARLGAVKKASDTISKIMA